MIVLGIEGALGDFQCAIVDGTSLRACRTTGPKQALERGLGCVADVLREASVAPHSLDRIACGIGPGGFTGLRIAITYAKSLAQGWQKPIAGISSFDVLELGREMALPALTVVTGRPGVISVRFRDASGERRASGLVAATLDAIAPLPQALTVAGATEDVLGALAERGITVQALRNDSEPAAVTVARLGASRAVAASLHEVRPDYGEAPAVRPPKHA